MRLVARVAHHWFYFFDSFSKVVNLRIVKNFSALVLGQVRPVVFKHSRRREWNLGRGRNHRAGIRFLLYISCGCLRRRCLILRCRLGGHFGRVLVLLFLQGLQELVGLLGFTNVLILGQFGL